MKKVIVITGASSGFGGLTAHELAKAGHVVYAGMRETAGRNAPQVEAAKKFAAENKVDLRTIELDVASQESVDAAIQQIVSKNGRLDVMIGDGGNGNGEHAVTTVQAERDGGVHSGHQDEAGILDVDFGFHRTGGGLYLSGEAGDPAGKQALE